MLVLTDVLKLEGPGRYWSMVVQDGKGGVVKLVDVEERTARQLRTLLNDDAIRESEKRCRRKPQP